NGVTTYNQDKLVLNQVEAFKSTGMYLLQELQPTPKLLVSLGFRYDDLNLKATDNYLTDGDQSGSRHFTKVNPMLGVNYALAEKVAVYANYASTFESPTLNELSNNPDNTGGFNPNIAPQQAKSYEIGSKGRYNTEGGYFDVAIFKIETENDLVPYQITGQMGKIFFRNAGKTERKGLEISFSYPITACLTVHYTHTFSDFRYKTYSVNAAVFDGKLLPAIPKNNAQFELRYADTNGFFTSIQGRIVDKVYANDANTAASAAYSILNLRLGHTFTLKDVQIEPFFGINNVMNTNYIANVQINAQSDRFFEPATLRYFFGGLKVRLNPVVQN
ncbi:MAG: TonB-dependent receptor, partial [Saprospiraceae bacterium]|nr:TonB-dependent receptor [Saprospiraceae bacterium]